jgi:predicted nucleic acid-binding protein
MSKIFWDTNLFIYLLEESPEYCKVVTELREKMIARGDQLITSAMTLGEVQIKPRRVGKLEEAALYKAAILQVASVIPFDAKAADAYSMIRERTNIKGADAIQLACASTVEVELFITNDTQLHKLSVPGIHFITPLDRLPF